jgi:probable HAF family extracellular repeat protein
MRWTACLLAPLLAAALNAGSPAPRYEVIDLGSLAWVSDDVAPHIAQSGEIAWWQTAPDRTVHAAAGAGSSPRDIGALPRFLSSIACRVNRAGQVVGWSVSGRNLVDSQAATHAFLFSGSQMLDLGALGGRDSKALDINDAGEVVGVASLPDDTRHAFLYRGGKLLDLGGLSDGAFSAAYAINNRGLIVGAAETSNHLIHAVLWRSKRMADLGTLPGGTRSRALALNERGDIVGYSEADGPDIHAFLYSDGHMQDLGSLGHDPIRANAINNHRQIVGASGINAFVRHAFIWENRRIVDLNKLVPANAGWRLQDSFDITDQGQILCLGIRADASRDRHLILLRPISAAAAYSPQ